MASRKRSRNLHDVDGDVEVESASSSLRNAFQKRSRLTLAAEHGGSVFSDDDDDEAEEENYNSHILEERLLNDSGSEASDYESENDDRDYQRATQVVQKSMRQHKDNVASDQGVIEQIYCRNFMCHAKLRINLGPLINFIIGHNGSGKSAVLTALTVCLGDGAKSTNRATSMRDLIKEGEESAMLAVKVKNMGDGAYKHSMYGDSITVERHFTRNGASSFKLKNAEGAVVSTKKNELIEIKDFFGLQVDNPINVLTQDLARQFLANSTAKSKYKFFLEGTQLQTLDQDYKFIEENVDKSESKLRSREDDIKVLKDKVDRAQERKKAADKTQVFQRRIQEYKNMDAWAQVEREEKTLEDLNKQVERSVELVEEAELEAERKSSIYDGHNQSNEAAQRYLIELKDQLVPLRESAKVEKEAFESGKRDLMGKKSDERRIRQELGNAKTRLQNAATDIAQEEERLAGAGGAEQTRRLQQLETLGDEVTATRERLTEHEDGLQQLQQDVARRRTEEDSAESVLGQARQELQAAESRLSRLERDQGQKYSSYRPGMEDLVRAVGRESRFRVKPVGPIGLHVHLKKPEWSSLLETTFGGVLESFVVTSKEDQNILSQVMKRANCQAPIFIGDSSPMRNLNEPQDQTIDTVLRVLDIDHDLVRNQLIIGQAIEQLVLIPDRGAAYQFVSSRPRNVRATMCISGKPGEGVRFETTRTGGEKSGLVRRWERTPRMKTSIEEQMRMARDAVAQAKRELNLKEGELKEKRRVHVVAKQAVNRHGRTKVDLKRDFQTAEDAVQAIKEEIESHRPQDGKLEELQRQLQETENELDFAKRQYQDLINEIDFINEAQKETKARMDAAQAEVESFEETLTKAEGRLKKASERREDALREKNKALNEIERIKREVTALEEERDKQQGTVDEYNTQASNYCHRVPVDAGEDPDSIKLKWEALERDLQRALQQIGGTREELHRAYVTAHKEHSEAAAQIKEQTDLNSTLKRALDNRQVRWKKFRRYITVRARTTFQYLLSERNFRGRLVVDHVEKMLDISVEPDLSRVSDAGRQAKTLSGGEKSFSTICLLLSIWEAMGSPLRCLDEFDVFMDNVNRATSMNLMIGAARRSVGRQFILITPQSMANVELGDDVKIHKMSDPERGQTALPFEPQA